MQPISKSFFDSLDAQLSAEIRSAELRSAELPTADATPSSTTISLMTKDKLGEFEADGWEGVSL